MQTPFVLIFCAKQERRALMSAVAEEQNASFSYIIYIFAAFSFVKKCDKTAPGFSVFI